MKYNKGFAPLILLAIIVGALAVGGGTYYLSKNSNNIKKEVKIEENNYQEENLITDNKEDIITEKQKDATKIDETSNWNKYTFTNTKYLPKSFSLKYPKEWKVEMGYYTEPASGKNVAMSVILTSPNGIGQISYSAGSPGYKITCASLLSNTEVPGKLSCIEKEGIPYFVVYQEEETLRIYNKIMSTFEFLN